VNTPRDVVRAAFFQTQAGHSTDDVVMDDALTAAFIAACHQTHQDATPFQPNGELYNLRKQPPGIGMVAAIKHRERHDDYLHAAAIAARHLEDKPGISIDRVVRP
jgi:hypothetical protein